MLQQSSTFMKNLFEKKGQTKSYCFMMVSCFCWVYGYVYANEHKFTPFQTNLSRSLVMVVGSYFICRLMGLNIEFRSPKSWSVLLKRHLAFILQGLVIAGVQFILPLGVAHTIGSAGPIFTLIMGRFVRKNHNQSISGLKLQGCLISVIGIFLTSNGKFIYGYFDKDYEFSSSFENYASSNYTFMLLATLVLLVMMLIWAYGVLITQEAGCHAFEIVFHFSVMNLIFSSVAYMLLPNKRPASEMYESLIWIGVYLLIAQICFTSALNLAQNIALTNISTFVTVVIGYGISILRYGETVDIISLLGTILVLTGVSFVILVKQQKKENSDHSNELNEILNKHDQIKEKVQTFYKH